MTAWNWIGVSLQDLGVNELEGSDFYALMRERMDPPHRTEPFIKVD